jgi:hypothetical protein
LSNIRDLPDRVFKFLEAGVVMEFATVSAAGVPIDTPTYYFPSGDMATIDLATGLVNPTKAERARRNPKVGLLMDGAADEPVVCVRGHAAVRDSDFEANARRYISETGFRQLGPSLNWAEARKAVQYWTRIIIEVTPIRILWWDSVVAMDHPPQVWNAAEAKELPASDPAPPGQITPGLWPVRPWQEVVPEAVAKGRIPHLTVCDEEGYPLPIRTRSFELADDGFKLVVPEGIPWRITGKATLSFEGHMIFVGEAVPDETTIFLKVERVLPQNRAAQDSKGVLQLNAELHGTRQLRLEAELRRRGKSIPAIPLEEPAPTRMAKLRQARIATGVPITGFKTAN